jgi:phasin family protein
MLVTQEQIAAANKSNMETLAQLSRKAFEGVEKLLELNLQVTKTLMHENVQHIEHAAQVEDVKEFLTAQANYVQPMTEKALSYSRHLYSILQDTRSEMTNITQDDLKKRTENFNELIKSFSLNTPESTNAMANLMKQAIANANTSFEASQKALKQAIDITTHQANTAAQSALKTSEKVFKAATAN